MKSAGPSSRARHALLSIFDTTTLRRSPLSATIGAVIAHLAFWSLLVGGWLRGELKIRGVVVFLALWAAAYFVSPYLVSGGGLFVAFEAVLAIALVLIVFKGDVRVLWWKS